MTQPHRKGFSLKSMLLAVAVIFCLLVLLLPVLRRDVSLGTVAFGTTLNGLYGAEHVRDELEQVLFADGFKPCDTPRGQEPRNGEYWYCGRASGTELLVVFHRTRSYIGVNVHAQNSRWVFESSTKSDNAKLMNGRVLAAELAVWWKQSKLLTAKPPIH